MPELTERQLKAIPFLVSAPTFSEGLRQAQVGRKTFYQWLKIPEFKEELTRQRQEVTREAFGLLEHSLTRAVETLTTLLDSEDEKVRRGVANDILEHIMKYREQQEFEDRLGVLEKAVANKPGP